MQLLTDISVGDTEGIKFAKLQRWLRYTADQASISYTMSGLLSDISVGDTDGVKWAKLQQWAKLIAQNITGGGGGGGGNAVASAANNAGDTTLTRTQPNMTYYLAVGGAARTSKIILATAGAVAGDVASVLAALPATAAIVLDFRNATAGGTALLPTIPFASNTFTTDGTAYTAKFIFSFNGTAWVYAGSNIPA